MLYVFLNLVHLKVSEFSVTSMFTEVLHILISGQLEPYLVALGCLLVFGWVVVSVLNVFILTFDITPQVIPFCFLTLYNNEGNFVCFDFTFRDDTFIIAGYCNKFAYLLQ